MLITKNYLYCCIGCKSEIHPQTEKCLQCEHGRLKFKLSNNDEDVIIECTKCKYSSHYTSRLPIYCEACHLEQSDWWHSDLNKWANLDLTPIQNTENSVWVVGDFDGDYIARIRPDYEDSNITAGYAAKFNIDFQNSYLKNIQYLENGPPLYLRQDEKRPMAVHQLVYPVDVQLQKQNGIINESMANTDFVRVGLADFRLHDWSFLGSIQSLDHEANSRYGRIKGRGYGLIKPYYPPPFEIEKRKDKSFEFVRNLNPNNSITNNSDLDTNKCSFCSFFWIGVFFVLTWIACSFKSAILFSGSLLIYCWIDSVLVSAGVFIKRTWIRWLLGLALLLLSGSTLFFNHLPSFPDSCQKLTLIGLVVSFICFYVSLFLKSCLVRTLLLLIFLLNTLSLCGIANNGCGESSYDDRIGPVNSVIRSYDNIQRETASLILHATNSDIDSSIINNASSSNLNGRRISLDEIVAHPDLLKNNCKNRVYIPFQFDSSEFDAEEEMKLQRFGEVLQRNYTGQNLIKITYETGHLKRRKGIISIIFNLVKCGLILFKIGFQVTTTSNQII